MGASTLSIVSLRKDKDEKISITDTNVTPHHGNPQKVLIDAVQKLNIDGDSRVAVTGRKFSQSINLTFIPEPEATENAFSRLNGQGAHYNAIVSAGGETFMIYALGKDGKISTVQAGNKCASGTGEFFCSRSGEWGFRWKRPVRLLRRKNPINSQVAAVSFAKVTAPMP